MRSTAVVGRVLSRSGTPVECAQVAVTFTASDGAWLSEYRCETDARGQFTALCEGSPRFAEVIAGRESLRLVSVKDLSTYQARSIRLVVQGRTVHVSITLARGVRVELRLVRRPLPKGGESEVAGLIPRKSVDDVRGLSSSELRHRCVMNAKVYRQGVVFPTARRGQFWVYVSSLSRGVARGYISKDVIDVRGDALIRVELSCVGSR